MIEMRWPSGLPDHAAPLQFPPYPPTEYALTSVMTRAASGLAGVGLALAAAGLSAFAAASAQAAPAEPVAATSTTTIPINPGNVPATADSHDDHSCDQVGEAADQDGWVFVLPGNDGAFVSLTLTFKTPAGETKTLRIPQDGGKIGTGNGTSKAWIRTAPGWTLIDAKAVITGESSNGEFNLTHTCPATGGSPSTSPTTGAPTETPTESPSQPGGSPTASPDESPSQTPGTSVGPTAAPSETPAAPVETGGNLPLTGVALGGILALGLALVGAGVALRAVKRRRDVTDTPITS